MAAQHECQIQQPNKVRTTERGSHSIALCVRVYRGGGGGVADGTGESRTRPDPVPQTGRRMNEEHCSLLAVTLVRDWGWHTEGGDE